MGLEHEQAVYQRNLGDLLANEGKFVIIKGDEVVLTPTDDYPAALRVGFERFGPVPFLVKKIERYEPVHYFSRDLRRCPN